MRALVYKSTGNRYLLKDEQGNFFSARLKGKIKLDDITSTNPIAVGDFVIVENPEDAEQTMITEIEHRNNYINRISPHNKNQHHIVASNLDQTILLATIKDPKTSLGFIDRFLVTAEAYHIPAIIVFNKSDILNENDLEYFQYIKKLYENIGYKMFLISVSEGKGMSELRTILKDKTTLLSGHSGVGKSSFINFLFPDKDLKTSEVSEWSGKGLHTTTFAEMYDLPEGGRIIDTPGIRELGLVNIEADELSHYFPEMRSLLNQCKFNNCQHINEPGCAIKKAVNEGLISEERFVSYLSLRDSILQQK